MEFSTVIPFITQSITEFLPISSTAHMMILSKIFSLEALNLAESAALHLIPGFIFAFYFKQDINHLFTGFWRIIAKFCKKNTFYDRNVEFFKAFFWGTIPVLICGLLINCLKIKLPQTIHMIGANSIIFGVLLGFIDLTTPLLPNKAWDSRCGKIFGFMHILAFVPGVSRLGICLTTARAMGFNSEESSRFSFICGIPVLISAGGYGLLQGNLSLTPFFSWEFFLLSFLMLILGFLVLHLFMHYIKKHTFLIFSLYRICLGILLLILI